MAVKKPLVMTDGRIEQLQAGDELDGANTEVRDYTNTEGATITICQAVYFSGADEVSLAQADATGTADVRGLVSDATILNSAAGGIRLGGVMEATTAQWDAVTGDTGGLIGGAKYFLDEFTPGAITRTAPTARGSIVSPIGEALNATDMRLNFEPVVWL